MISLGRPFVAVVEERVERAFGCELGGGGVTRIRDLCYVHNRGRDIWKLGGSDHFRLRLLCSTYSTAYSVVMWQRIVASHRDSERLLCTDSSMRMGISSGRRLVDGLLEGLRMSKERQGHPGLCRGKI